ncbi:MAG TPA: amino acid adenylation domain-containing protein, partial [Thermoanaerobaculia bacterium]|nr:amino acid adenylation domain-containing protein [Thermoanaerobaculia bacterium]
GRAGGEHLLLLTLHHIAGDAWSLDVLARELAAFYRAHAAATGVSGGPGAAAAGALPVLPTLPIQYSDFARWQREWLAGEVLAAEVAWWREQLAGPRGEPPVLDLPLDRPRPAVPSRRGERRPMALPDALAAELAALARRRGVTLFMVLLAAFDTLLLRYSGQSDVTIGTPVANRDRLETQDLVGLFVNTLVLRLDLAGDPTFGELLARTRQLALGAFAHRDVPFDKLAAELAPHGPAGSTGALGPAATPFFQVLFALQPALPAPVLPGLAVAILEGDSGTAKFDLSLAVSRSAAGGLTGIWTHGSDLFDPATAARLSGQLCNLLHGIAAAGGGDRRLAELPLLAPSERHQALIEWNAATWEAGGDGLVHAPFERQAALHPEAIALVLGEAGISYGELEARANRLAHTLRSLGLGPDGIAGICAEPSCELVIGLLAILKAGGAYLPLDPAHPQERLGGVIAGSGARLVLAGAAVAERLPGTVRPLLLDDPHADGAAADLPPAARTVPARAAPARAAPARAVPALAPDPDNAAYVLYTSGSTGAPKGVVVSHRAVVNRLRFQVATDLAPDARMLQRTRLGFDVSVIEIFAPLWLGAAVVLIDPAGQQDAAYLARLIVDQQVTNAAFPPALFPALLADTDLCRCRSLRRVVTGADKVPADLARRYHAVMADPAPLLASRYGPTEATISVAEWRCEKPEAAASLAAPPSFAAIVPLGRPIAGTRFYLLDPALCEVPPGAPGELCIAGVCLARGYLGRPDLTAAAFVPDPLAGRADRLDDAGARLYRTGDLARYRAGGVLEFLGRIDRQVKIRGLRLELGEVEAACARHPDVQEVAVLDVEAPAGGGTRLAAYLVPRPGSDLAGPAGAGAGRLRAFLADRLPAFMVPSVFVTLPRLPLTANGKLDRRALARLQPPAEPGRGEPDPPRTAVEELVAGLWQEILGDVRPRR